MKKKKIPNKNTKNKKNKCYPKDYLFHINNVKGNHFQTFNKKPFSFISLIKLKKRNYNTILSGQKNLYKACEENDINYIFNKSTNLNLKDIHYINGCYTDTNKIYR